MTPPKQGVIVTKKTCSFAWGGVIGFKIKRNVRIIHREKTSDRQ